MASVSQNGSRKRRPWTAQEQVTAEVAAACGVSCKEIGRVLNRSFNVVLNHLDARAAQRLRENQSRYREANIEKVRERNRTAARRRRKANPDQDREYQRLYRKLNLARVRERERLWREANLERHKETSRRWRKANLDVVRERKRRYYAANADKCRARSRQWASANSERVRDNQRRYYEANADKLREASRNWHKANRDKSRENCRRWYELNANKAQEDARTYRATNADKVQISKRAYYESNRNKVKEYISRWRKSNLNKIKEYSRRRNAWKRAARQRALHPVTHQQIEARFAIWRNRCAFCGVDATHKRNHGRERLTVEHVLALTKGGLDEASNIIPACTACNSSKHNSPIEDWYRKQPFFTAARWAKIQKHCPAAVVGQLPLALAA